MRKSANLHDIFVVSFSRIYAVVLLVAAPDQDVKASPAASHGTVRVLRFLRVHAIRQAHV
jgi:hypothetical protein